MYLDVTPLESFLCSGWWCVVVFVFSGNWQLHDWVQMCDQWPEESSEDHSSPGELPLQVDHTSWTCDQGKQHDVCIEFISILRRLCFSYRKCMEEFVKGSHGNMCLVIKANLMCEQQLRYVTCWESSHHDTEQLQSSSSLPEKCLDSLFLPCHTKLVLP